MSVIEFEPEGFRLYRRPKHNKKERRHLGLDNDRVVMIEVAGGNIRKRGTLRYIVRTAAIVASDFNSTTGFFTFSTENGKDYRVRYKPAE
jgi:hypothetical protein